MCNLRRRTSSCIAQMSKSNPRALFTFVSIKQAIPNIESAIMTLARPLLPVANLSHQHRFPNLQPTLLNISHDASAWIPQSRFLHQVDGLTVEIPSPPCQLLEPPPPEYGR
jgi:hypothetical protein